METSETEKAYVYTLKVPNMKENRLNVAVEEDRISIEGEFSQTIERKNNNGNFVGKNRKDGSPSRNAFQYLRMLTTIKQK